MAEYKIVKNIATAPQSTLEIIRYGLAGLANMAVGFVIYTFCISILSAPFWLANLAAIICGLICGFILAQKFVFTTPGQGKFGQRAIRYFIVIMLQFILTTVVIGVLIAKGHGEIIAYLIVLPFAIGLSFGLQKFWVFKVSSDKSISGVSLS